MSSAYIRRAIEPLLREAASEFPVVTLTGPRQSGKTTTLKKLFSDSHGYLSLEYPDVRAAATGDPRGFLERYAPPMIFDEVQYAAELLPYIKERVDLERDRRGQYLLTGSQNLLLLERVTESLAGRAAMLRLLPLSRAEAEGRPDASFAWERNIDERERTTASPAGQHAYMELWESFLRGGFPELVAQPARNIYLWHGSYLQTYLERDVRTLRQVGDLSGFQSFLRMLAARSGQLLNLSDISRDLGITVNTVKAWLSVLEASFQVTIVRPYFANIGKRLVKTPKIYFTDVGTLCHISGLRDPEHAAAGPLGGAILETAVLSEIVRTRAHRGEEPRVWFWRTSTGTEVDFLVETATRLIPIEVKLSATPSAAMAAGIRSLRRDLGDKVDAGFVVHPGSLRLPLGPEAEALPFASLASCEA